MSKQTKSGTNSVAKTETKTPVTKAAKPTIAELTQSLEAMTQKFQAAVAAGIQMSEVCDRQNKAILGLEQELTLANEKNYAFQQAICAQSHAIQNVATVSVRPGMIGDPRNKTQTQAQTASPQTRN